MIKPFVAPITALLVGGSMAIGAHAAEPAAPTPPLPTRWVYQPECRQTLPDEDIWWRRFEDPLLDSLVRAASVNNFNLMEAMHRREVARLAVKQAQSGYWPTLSVAASYGRDRTQGVTTDTYSLGAQMNWEIDVFGKIGAAVKAKKAAYRASRADYTAAMVSMAADVATYYIDYRVLQAHVAIANEHLASQGKVVKIAEARHEAGLVSKLDVAQAKTVYLTTQATLPQLESSMRSTLTALATLLGVYPDSIAPVLEGGGPLPAHEMLIPAGVPADLLRRRPDIIAAEAQLAECAAEVGVAKKEFLPTLSLTGEIGTIAPEPGDMFTGRGFHYSVAPTLSWTVFDGLSRSYGVAQAREQMQSALDSYNLTVMTAVGEVDNAMASYRAALQTLDIDRQLLEQSREALSLSMDQYKQGLSAFTNVVDAQIDMLTAANAIVTARGEAIISLIDIYRSLGGSPNP